MAVLDPQKLLAPISLFTPLPDRGHSAVTLFKGPVEFGWVLRELWAFKVIQNGGRTVKTVFKTVIAPEVPVVERRDFLRGSGRDLGYPHRGSPISMLEAAGGSPGCALPDDMPHAPPPPLDHRPRGFCKIFRRP
ncbi:hypothetical protein ACJJTC_005237 [Scirpophaga incertulas]